jgi:hypothetical protein
VVVPIGTAFLESSTRQGFITRQVTDTMNACGVFALALMAWDLVTAHDSVRLRSRARICLFILMVAAAIGLMVLHPRLEALLDVESESVVDRHAFKPLHRAYLWISSGQWACALAYMLLTLAAWRNEDRSEVVTAVPAG